VSLPLIAFVVEALAILTLAGFVIRRNPKSATHNLFGLFALALVMWATVNYISIITPNYSLALWTIRLVMVFAVLQSVLFALLIHTFPRATLALSRKALSLIAVVTLLGVAISLSPFLFPSITFQEGKAPQPTPSWGMAIFLPITLGSLLWGFWLLVKKNIRSTGIQKVQQRYLLVGFLITFGLLVTLLLFFATVLNDTRFVPYAPLFTLPFVGLTAYAIIRYRLMDIRAAIARSLSFSFLLGAFFLIYAAILAFAVPAFSQLIGLRVEILAAIAALISIPIARYVQQVLTKLTDRFLFQDRPNYEQALPSLSRGLSRTIDIEDVTATVLFAMRSIVRTRKVGILLRQPESGSFVPQAQEGMRNFDVTIQPDNVLVLHLKHAQTVVAKDELAIQKEQDPSADHRKEISVIQDSLDWLDVSVVIPLFVNKALTGLILLGDKLSGRPYLQEDIQFLDTFSPQAAVALENARLYKESLEFGQTLKEEVERATAELATANEQLKDLDKAKSEFLSIASHQLYTPLTALRGYLSMLMEGEFGKIPTKQAPIMDILETSSVRLIALIKSLLDISRIESGRLELDLESVDLTTMAKELVRDLMPNAAAKKLKLAFHPPAKELPHAVVDRQRIRQVMLNFTDNAIKYTDHGRIDVRLKQADDDLVFSVTDTGRGIARQDITRLFNKFTRVRDPSRLHAEGIGLGLYVAKQMVKEHHGDVQVASAGPGRGSTFSMRLPIEGSPTSLRVGEKATVEIKAAEAQGQPTL